MTVEELTHHGKNDGLNFSFTKKFEECRLKQFKIQKMHKNLVVFDTSCPLKSVPLLRFEKGTYQKV